MTISLMTISDELQKWLENQGVWEEVSSAIRGSRYLPFEDQARIRSELKLDDDCQVLLGKLLQDSNGISMMQLGVEPREVNRAIRDGDCSSAKLVNLKLARIQDKELLKALPIAFSAEVQYLVGFAEAF